MRSGSLYASGFSNTAFTTLNIAAFAPIPSAITSTATIVNPRRLSGERQLELCMQCHLETTSARLPHHVRGFPSVLEHVEKRDHVEDRTLPESLQVTDDAPVACRRSRYRGQRDLRSHRLPPEAAGRIEEGLAARDMELRERLLEAGLGRLPRAASGGLVFFDRKGRLIKADARAGQSLAAMGISLERAG